MNCTRCEGLMVGDFFLDMQESGGPMWIKGWRCVSCGNLSDPLIHRHRLAQRSGVSLSILTARKEKNDLELLPISA